MNTPDSWLNDDVAQLVVQACLLITSKAKRPISAPVQTGKTVQDYTLQGLAEIAEDARQRPTEQLGHWLLCLYDHGSNNTH